MLFGMLFLVFCVSFVFSSSTYAAEDIEVTLTSRPSSSITICSSNCSSYKYLILVPHDFYTSNHNIWYNSITFNVSWNFTSSGIGIPLGIYGFPIKTVLELSSPVDDSSATFSSLILTQFYSEAAINSLSPGWSFDIILSENNPDSSGIIPSGSLSITENGTYDVINYAEVVVDIPTSSGGGGGNYHDDLVAINNSILICAATCLVLYFFYCIYRMIIKSTGGWR